RIARIRPLDIAAVCPQMFPPHKLTNIIRSHSKFILKFARMNLHERYMRRCLDLARLAQKNVSPNPMVGAVIVVDNKIVGEGHTSAYGGPHAEVNAVQDVLRSYGLQHGKELLRGATVYVSLDPCAHHGKTPPCTDLLLENQVANVVVGCLDPFAKVNGLGVQKLRRSEEASCRERVKRVVGGGAGTTQTWCSSKQRGASL